MDTECPRELGIGVVYSPRLAQALNLSLVDVLEIEPQMFWQATGDRDDPVRLDRELFSQLRAMPQHKLAHSVTLPIGNSRPHDPRALERLGESVAALGAPYVSEHLSFNQFDAGRRQLWTGFLLPPRQDERGVELAAARLDEMRRAVGVPVAFETGVNYLQPRGDELSDGGFIRSVAEAADCGIVLDLHNLLTNERNGRAPVRAVLAEIPLERVWEIHLAGGMKYRGYWLDSHSAHIEEELLHLAQEVADGCPNLRAIVFEIMGQYVRDGAQEALRRDVQRLQSLWAARRTAASAIGVQPSPRRPRPDCADATAARLREDALGALTLGLTPRIPDPILAGDAAVPLYADLVASMREGVLYETLPFTVRLLLVSIGPQATMDLISAYRASAPPEPFGSEEARTFARYVRTLDLRVDHLGDVLAFEEALLAARGTAEARTLTFECDPAALFHLLLRRQSPVELARERFVVEVSAGAVRIQSRLEEEGG